MKRRDFITGIASAMSWPLAARAQQSAMPVIGFLNRQSPETYADRLRAFHRGLRDTDHVESENVTTYTVGPRINSIDCRSWAADLIRRRVAVIAAGNTPSKLGAKAVPR
jgi:putative tryptophan/tyrosine transport system substrate-binding protein